MNKPYPFDITELQFKKRKIIGGRYYTTKDKTDILFILKVYKNKLSDDAIANVYK